MVRISHMVFGVLLLGLVMTGFYTFIGDLASEDSYDESYEDYSTTFNNINEISDQMNESYTEIADEWKANTASTFQIITLVPDALMLLINTIKLPFSIMGGLVTDIIIQMGLADFGGGTITTFLIASITALLIFGVIALVLRYRYT